MDTLSWSLRMTAKERVLAALDTAPGPVCDDCLPKMADLSARQVAYTTCTALAGQGRIGRGRGSCKLCGKFKTVSWGLTARQPEPQHVRTLEMEAPKAKRVLSTRPWYWEGNIQSVLVAWLVGRGYMIRSVTDTAAREQGKDIVAVSPDGRELWVSVKGYPEKSAGVQARHWFAGALFDLVVYRGESPDADLALGLPDGFGTYAGLASRVAWLRIAMPFTIYWVAESGAVLAE